jgi:hypothetical protein
MTLDLTKEELDKILSSLRAVAQDHEHAASEHEMSVTDTFKRIAGFAERLAGLNTWSPEGNERFIADQRLRAADLRELADMIEVRLRCAGSLR